MKRKPLIIGLVVVVAIVATVVGVFLGLGGGGVEIPINAQDADDVGALHIELGYDPAVLQATSVEEGSLAGNAIMEYNIYDEGWVVLSMVDSTGMNGNGSLAVVTFQVVGTEGMTCSLTLENLTAWDATDVFDIPIESSAGSFAVEGGSFTAPVIIFSP